MKKGDLLKYKQEHDWYPRLAFPTVDKFLNGCGPGEGFIIDNDDICLAINFFSARYDDLRNETQTVELVKVFSLKKKMSGWLEAKYFAVVKQ